MPRVLSCIHPVLRPLLRCRRSASTGGLRMLALLACPMALACDPAGAPTSEPASGDQTAAEAPPPEATPDSNATSDAPPPPETELVSQPASQEAEEEPGPRLADGRPIAPCEDAPAGMACIPGGPFIRGSDDGPENARPAQTIELQTYYMDLNEITSAEYKACKATKACPRRGPLYNDFSRDDQPIVGVSWFAAVDYCKWVGKHLPTEAEWEKAARGPDGEANPFGNDPVTCENAVIEDERGKSCGVEKKMEHPKKGRTFVIGSRPAGRYGLFDMAGNAWEWVADWDSPSWSECGEACQGVDPKGPCDGALECPGHEKRVVKGGSWYWKADRANGWFRRTHYPQNEIQDFHHFGFRCAATLEEAAALEKRPTQPEPSPTP